MSDWMIEDTREPRDDREELEFGFSASELDGADFEHDDVEDE